MVFVKRSNLICFVLFFAMMANNAFAEVKIYTDRALFEARLDGAVTDDYEHPGYTTGDIRDEADLDGFSEAAMNAVLGETTYAATNPSFIISFMTIS